MSFWGRLMDFRFGKPAPRRAKRGFYAGAETNRLTSFFSSGLQSPTKELLNELTTLRSRSRELCRNSPLGARYLRLVAENVAGRDGIALQARATMRDGSPDEKANAAIEDAWWRWGKSLDCTVDKSATWPGFLRRVAALRAQDGEAFIRLHEGFDNAFGFAVQLIDADLIDTQHNETNADGSPKIVMGVEVNRWGAPVAYHVLTRHPAEAGMVQRERVRVPASEMLHVFRKVRPGQVRGVPDLAAVMVSMDMLSGYVEAALVEARTAASKQGFIEQGPDAEPPDLDDPATRYTEASPGSIDYLDPGQTFVGWDPKSPSGNFGPFVTKAEKMIATGLNVSYMGLTGDLSENSFASSRTGLLQERDAWRIDQTDIAGQLCDPLYKRWLRLATLKRQLKLESEELARYEAVEWRGRSWAWVDPEKDINSSALGQAYGLADPHDIAAEQGKDLRDIYAGIAKAQALAEEMGIEIAKPSGVALPPPEPVDPPPPVKDEQADEDRAAVAKAVQSIDGAIKWIAAREQPAPIVNVTSPPVDVRVGGPKKGAEFVVKRNARGEVTGAEFVEPAESEA